MAAVLQDKEGTRITLEATSKDKSFVEYVSDKCEKESTILLYRPTVASCRYSLTDHPTSLKVVEDRTVILGSSEHIDTVSETSVSFGALQPGGVHKVEGLLIYKSRISTPTTARGDRDVMKIVIKDMNGIMGGIAISGDMAHLPELKKLKVREDVVVVSGVQYDQDQGCSSTRNTTIARSDASAPAVAGIGLTYRVCTVDRITPWARDVQSLAGNKWTTMTALASFTNLTKIDSIGYAAQPAAIRQISLLTITAADVLSVKIWPNEFALVTGAHLKSFSAKPPNEQLENLNTRLKNRSFAMHLRIRENPNTQYSQFQANVIGLELPPEFRFFNKKYKAE
ncbi:hypothetical protein KFL_011030010 [Klebsormidium nitens]|uniref:Uncharacterized protein n=1 Tax=Klebsormidium nitens TaxID=105231 RepID=A0A1Y1ITQ8_KLENI|nr:hypothetical protein KFL_011030010 [Klebsormidium nitens]|eukprot:GAQ92711.1 hypothetical protein KFL_011030010 [Klebsormidium nitens]